MNKREIGPGDPDLSRNPADAFAEVSDHDLKLWDDEVLDAGAKILKRIADAEAERDELLQQRDSLKAALECLRRAIEFLDAYRAASDEERMAVGRDAYDNLEHAARKALAGGAGR